MQFENRLFEGPLYVPSPSLGTVLLGPTQKRPRFLPALLVTLGALLCASPTRAGVLHERFVQELNRTAADGVVSGLVTLAEQIDFARLEEEMTEKGITGRAERHAYALRSAETLAHRTQSTILASLQMETETGRVRSFEPFWVTNTIAVTAQPQVFLALSLRKDTGVIYPNDQVSLRLGQDEPDGSEARLAGGVRTLADALVATNVQHAWDLGYTGTGRLVCLFDTGADGDHPALQFSWRGAQPGVSWWEAWKDPQGNTEFPYDAGTHGTHVLGIMVAHPEGEQPMMGMAYDAEWIAAGVLFGYNVQNVLACYQWAADPDGDPATMDDVPDVINNSWGTTGDCDQTFWNAIDLVEAAGIVNTIAVDNTGPGYASVNSPESRADTPYKNFSVGNVDPHQAGYPIYPSSGRGPSPCDFSSIKPEMTAPGTQILSTMPGGSYGNKTGTSMACPHVSGAVAILRQVNPDLTVEQIKDVIMLTASDRGVPGEDNDYGWGVLDLGAAVDYVLANHPPSPPPRNLVLVGSGGVDVHLDWQRPIGAVAGNPVTGYKVYRATGEDPYPAEPIAQMDTTETAFVDAGRPTGPFRYVVSATYLNGVDSRPSNELKVTVPDLAAVETGRPAAVSLRLTACPNPFRATTELRLERPAGPSERIEIFDASGSRVRTLTDQDRVGFSRQLYRWDGQDDQGRSLAAGAYFVTLTSRDQRVTRRLTLLR
jgi:subtilisin family serine protease